jgi:hypothetical protein
MVQSRGLGDRVTIDPGVVERRVVDSPDDFLGKNPSDGSPQIDPFHPTEGLDPVSDPLQRPLIGKQRHVPRVCLKL